MSAKQRKKSPKLESKEKLSQREASAKQTPPGQSNTSIIKRSVIRCGIVIGFMIFVKTYLQGQTECLASVKENVAKKEIIIPCSNDYEKEKKKFKGCVPIKCGRFIMDDVVTMAEARQLTELAKKGLSFGGSSGGASILDLHSGALSKGDKFINIYSVLEESGKGIFTEEDFQVYRRVKNKIHKTISAEFNVEPKKLYLTKPTFFSRMTTQRAKTLHDEYWHPHVDKETYGSFHYTSLLYLSDYGSDFTGGRFTFTDKEGNSTVEPKFGRLSFFTSGSENTHYVEKLESGVRYAITVSFTCDKEKAIQDPTSIKTADSRS